MLLRISALFIAFFGLTACVNLKPREDLTKTYVLGPVDLSSSESVKGDEFGYIARPHLPVYLEGYAFKMRASNGEITNLPNARWAEPMDVGIARALSNYIAVESSGVKSSFYPWPKSAASPKTLHVRFHQLVATDDGRIQVSASWEFKEEDGPSQLGSFSMVDDVWSAIEPQSMVAGVNTALQALAEQIVESVKKDKNSPKDY